MKKNVLVGAGQWGRNLFRVLIELRALYGICEVNLNKIDFKIPEKIRIYRTFDDVMLDKQIDAVVIATPAYLHYEMSKKALLANKDVFVEKPLALSVREGKELVDLALKVKKILMVGHILQYHPAVIKLKSIIASGKLGKICYIYSNRLNIGKLRLTENILWSFAPHDISVILMLLGEEPVNILAFGGDYINSGIADVTLTAMEFKNGVRGHVFVSWLHPYKEQKLIIVGSKAMVVFDDLSQDKLVFYPHKIEWKDGKIPIAQKANHDIIPIDKTEPLRLEMKHFINCVKTREAPITDGREGLRVLNVIESAEKFIGTWQGPLAEQQNSNFFAHKSVCMDDGVTVGNGTKIWHFSHILKNSMIGENCVIGQNASIGPNVIIGNRCKIQNNVSLYTGVELEDEVFCGPSSVFTNVYNPRAFIERKNEFKRTLVKHGATIGANATIVCGSTIGSFAFIGAGSVVKKDVPDYALVVGVPAKQVGWICECATRLKKINKNTFACIACKKEYKILNNKLTR